MLILDRIKSFQQILWTFMLLLKYLAWACQSWQLLWQCMSLHTHTN